MRATDKMYERTVHGALFYRRWNSEAQWWTVWPFRHACEQEEREYLEKLAGEMELNLDAGGRRAEREHQEWRECR